MKGVKGRQPTKNPGEPKMFKKIGEEALEKTRGC
jgi:phosphoribosyl-ATP pyrophosphohydrolase